MFYQTCRAVAHMHKQTPPVIHRDLKVCIHCESKVMSAQYPSQDTQHEPNGSITSNNQRLVKCFRLVFFHQGWLCIVLLDQLAHQCINSLETGLRIVYLTTYLSHGH